MGTYSRIAAAALAAGALAGVAHASPPAPAAGTFVAPPPVPDRIEERGGNCFVALDDVFALEGTLAGTLAMDLRLVFHGPCFAAPGNFHARGTFTGTAELDGVERVGTFDFVFNGRFDEGPHAGGLLVIRHGTGELAGLHGRLVLDGVPGVGGTYAGHLGHDRRRGSA